MPIIQDKFKVLGKNSAGGKIYRISDFYLAHNNLVEEIYKRRIGLIIEQDRKRKREDLALQDSLFNTLNRFIDSHNEGLSDDAMREQRKMTL